MNYIPNDEQRIKETTTNDKKNSFPNIINGQSYSTFFFSTCNRSFTYQTCLKKLVFIKFFYC